MFLELASDFTADRLRVDDTAELVDQTTSGVVHLPGNRLLKVRHVGLRSPPQSRRPTREAVPGNGEPPGQSDYSPRRRRGKPERRSRRRSLGSQVRGFAAPPLTRACPPPRSRPSNRAAAAAVRRRRRDPSRHRRSSSRRPLLLDSQNPHPLAPSLGTRPVPPDRRTTFDAKVARLIHDLRKDLVVPEC